MIVIIMVIIYKIIISLIRRRLFIVRIIIITNVRRGRTNICICTCLYMFMFIQISLYAHTHTHASWSISLSLSLFVSPLPAWVEGAGSFEFRAENGIRKLMISRSLRIPRAPFKILAGPGCTVHLVLYGVIPYILPFSRVRGPKPLNPKPPEACGRV